jgi:segregation and condensation protein A
MADRLSAVPSDATFVVDLEGFAGPLDLLLGLAREHKVDLARISILALADQYLAYLRQAQELRLEIAAEYLVMAAWLAFLKSQLLLPPAEREPPDAEELAEALAERLRRLEAIRAAAAMLAARPRLGADRLARGMPEPPPVARQVELRATLAALFRAYGDVMRRGRSLTLRVAPRPAMSVEAALSRLSRLLVGHDWRDLVAYLPPGLASDLARRSALAASLVASLELARQGRVELSQAAPFAPIMVRRRAVLPS